ncbi:MAG: hypothetical protein K2N11_00640, partial [Mucispirillum sp.]|nr:hypothetical protein [Mucispirillum sp.]
YRILHYWRINKWMKIMSFWEGFNKLLFGENKASSKQQEQYDKVANYDNRMKDFESLSGSAVNEMANRGVINSSVTAKALGSAAAAAENNYWNDQIKLLGYSYGTDKKGIAEDLSSTFTKSFVKSLF